MDFLPVNIRISDARILIVGGGRVATHKATILSRFTSAVTVIAPQVSDGIKALPFRWEERDFSETDLDGVTLLFVCTGDHTLNHHIHSLARQRGVLTSVCDSPAECDFTSPAIFREGGLTIAVASDAKDVRRSIRVRDRIKNQIENGTLSIE
ncbi:MAG: bifunctional precorrin-2 dehydrogenase/sirohydrochlorin ferrochelatase [Prevotella sp.]|nr:bifunctional precorrin-2 dehydrogenase/sirohydrochlorin ferrochelatase [Prevotella sp.]